MRDMIKIKTSAGRLAVRMSEGARAPLLLIHGNSMSSSAFEGLMNSPFGRSYRMIAVDLPGHGESDNAAFPEKTYTMPGYADALLDVLFALDINEASILGWSLGGHIALEMMCRSQAIRGAFLVAAPPVSPGPDAINGFVVSDSLGLFMTETLDATSRRALAESSAGAPAPEFALRAVERCDGRARRILVESMLGGVGADPATLFDDPARPLALVTGEHERFTSTDFLKRVAGEAIWGGGPLQIHGAGHAPFLDAPEAFNAMLLAFLRDVSRRASARPSPAAAPERLSA